MVFLAACVLLDVYGNSATWLARTYGQKGLCATNLAESSYGFHAAAHERGKIGNTNFTKQTAVVLY